ncbi:hypothetical protein AB1Y20_010333 [Prymnesium parvum]|uniref:EF-hand domain-containing protein n=1 Tax=Prymnesium parvum TaxID=97485 RepID=A0AB34K6H6_PRYPA
MGGGASRPASGGGAPPAAAQQVWEALDTDHLPIERACEIVRSLDRNGDGVLSRQELFETFSRAGGKLLAPSLVFEAPPHACATLRERALRDGIWFVVHRSLLAEIAYDECLDLYECFFAYHPNGGPWTAGFVCVRLSEAAILSQRERIRMSSYRWEMHQDADPQRSGDFVCPGNFRWFLELIERRRLIGWVDFIANIGVNVPKEQTLAYMGQLYAELIVSADWLHDVGRLEVALKRGWIFQESAFTELDGDGVEKLFECMRAIGKRFLAGHPKDVEPFFDACVHFGELLHRRGYDSTYTSLPYFGPLGWDSFGDVDFTAFALKWHLRAGGSEPVVVASHRRAFMRQPKLAFVHACELFSLGDAEYALAAPQLRAHMAQMRWRQLADVDAFVRTFGEAITKAYLGAEFTVAADREVALTATGCHIARALGGGEVDGAAMLRLAWRGTLRYMRAQAEAQQTNFFNTYGGVEPGQWVKPDIFADGGEARALGDVALRGALLERNEEGCWGYPAEEGWAAAYHREGAGALEAAAVADLVAYGALTDFLIEEAEGKLVHKLSSMPVAVAVCLDGEGTRFHLVLIDVPQGRRVAAMYVMCVVASDAGAYPTPVHQVSFNC